MLLGECLLLSMEIPGILSHLPPLSGCSTLATGMFPCGLSHQVEQSLEGVLGGTIWCCHVPHFPLGVGAFWAPDFSWGNTLTPPHLPK